MSRVQFSVHADQAVVKIEACDTCRKESWTDKWWLREAGTEEQDDRTFN